MGEAAAVITSLLWTFSAVIFTIAGRQLGALILNRFRLLFSVMLILIAHSILRGSFLPNDAGVERWLWLGLSGLIGLTLGDLALYKTYLLVGPRIGTLILASSPVLSTLLAWIVLGETLSANENMGILLSAAGIALVIVVRGASNLAGLAQTRDDYVRGVLFGILAAIAQATGMIMTKQGLSGNFPVVSGVLIRMLVASILIWLPAIFNNQVVSTFRQIHASGKWRMLILGTFIGPFAGIWLSTFALQSTPVGITSILTSLNPIFLIPVSAWIFKEKISPRALVGTVITFAGLGCIFLL